jgi:hypothetical protein
MGVSSGLNFFGDVSSNYRKSYTKYAMLELCRLLNDYRMI